MVVLVVQNGYHVSVTSGLERVFFKQVGMLLYVSLVISFFSLISTRFISTAILIGLEFIFSLWSFRLKIEANTKQGFFRTKGKLLFGLHSLIALVTKIFSIVFFFAPTLGLFHLGTHYRYVI